MPAGRYFIDSPLELEKEVVLSQEEGYHLIRVMRGRLNDEVELVNGKYVLAKGRVISIDKYQVRVKIDSCFTQASNTQQLILCQALPRLNRLETILEKGTELGANAFWLFQGDLSEKKDINLKRAQNILVSAMKQCGRLDLPSIVIKPDLHAWQAQDFPEVLYFGALEKNTPLFSAVWNKSAKQIGFVVGPEAGLSHKEISVLQNLGAIGVKLHHHTLRADTAPLVALSLMQHWLAEC